MCPEAQQPEEDRDPEGSTSLLAAHARVHPAHRLQKIKAQPRAPPGGAATGPEAHAVHRGRPLPVGRASSSPPSGPQPRPLSEPPPPPRHLLLWGRSPGRPAASVAGAGLELGVGRRAVPDTGPAGETLGGGDRLAHGCQQPEQKHAGPSPPLLRAQVTATPQVRPCPWPLTPSGAGLSCDLRLCGQPIHLECSWDSGRACTPGTGFQLGSWGPTPATEAEVCGFQLGQGLPIPPKEPTEGRVPRGQAPSPRAEGAASPAMGGKECCPW